MHAPALLAFALREQLVSFDAVVALARTGPPWEAAQLSWGLAAHLNDAELQALQSALRGRGVEGHAIQAELIARGFVDLEHWEVVFAPEEAREIARTALAGP